MDGSHRDVYSPYTSGFLQHLPKLHEVVEKVLVPVLVVRHLQILLSVQVVVHVLLLVLERCSLLGNLLILLLLQNC